MIGRDSTSVSASHGARWLLRLALCASPSLAVAPLAYAADVLPSAGLIEVLPVGGVAGDGHTQIALDAVLRTPTGAPIVAAKLKATVSAGTIGDVTEVGDGVYTATFVPPKVDAPTTVVVSFKGRTTELGAVEATRVIPIGPALEGRITITSSQPAVTLGTDANVTLSFAFPAAAGEASTAADLDIRTSSGTVADVVSVGAGRFSARFTPPAVNFPHLAVITVVDRRNPGRVWGTFSLPLQGKVDYPVTAPPGANVVLRLAGKEYGPSLASAAGRATVPIIVPPGLNAATQVVSQGTSVTESTLDLRVPDGRRIELFSVPASVPSDSRGGVPIRVVVTKGDGTPDVSAQVTLTATAGRLTDPRHAGDGVYVATFTPPDGRAQMAATIQASIGGSSAQADSLEIALIPSLPSRLDLSAEPTSLSADTTGLKIYASLTAADGTGLPGRSLRIGAAGATQKGDVVDLKGGDYRADFSTNGNTDVFVRVVALAPASANPVRRVVLLPAFSTVAPGAAQPVVIVTTDEFGYPVPNVDVTLAVAEGGGTVPNSVTTDAHGIAEIVYHAGSDAGLAALEARSGGASTAVSFYQSTGTLAPLPVPGSAEDRAVTTSWRASASSVIVDREGGADAPIDATNAAVTTAATGLVVAANPSQAPAGSSVTLDVSLADDAGVGVAGKPIEFFATGGARVGALADLGGGKYRTTVVIPDDAAGSIKVNVVVDGGKQSQLLEIPIGPAITGDVWGTGAPTDGSATDGTVASVGSSTADQDAVVEEKEERRPFLRSHLSMAVGGYQYAQEPGADPGDLLPSRLAWGGKDGGAPTPVGLAVGARVIIPKVPYVGFQGDFKWMHYSVSSSQFDSPAVDNLYNLRVDAIVRYPIAIKKSELSFGARVGFRYDDFITFSGCIDPGCTISYGPLKLPGLGAGLEIGAEIGPVYLLASGGAGFAYGSVPYAANADLNVGWNITKFFLIDAGFSYQHRRADLEGADSGIVRASVSDNLTVGTIGVGFSY